MVTSLSPEVVRSRVFAELYAGDREQVIGDHASVVSVVDDLIECWLDPGITALRRHDRGLSSFVAAYCARVEGLAGSDNERRDAWRRHVADLAGGETPPITRRMHIDDVSALTSKAGSTITAYVSRAEMPQPDGRLPQGKHVRPWWHPPVIYRWDRGRGSKGPRPTSTTTVADLGRIAVRPQRSPWDTWAVTVTLVQAYTTTELPPWTADVQADSEDPVEVTALVLELLRLVRPLREGRLEQVFAAWGDTLSTGWETAGHNGVVTGQVKLSRADALALADIASRAMPSDALSPWTTCREVVLRNQG